MASPPGFIQWGILGATAGTIALILLIQAIAMRIGGNTVHGEHTDKTIHGSARWTRKKDIKESGLWRKEGVVVGGLRRFLRGVKALRHNGLEHILAFAPTGSGKGDLPVSRRQGGISGRCGAWTARAAPPIWATRIKTSPM